MVTSPKNEQFETDSVACSHASEDPSLASETPSSLVSHPSLISDGPSVSSSLPTQPDSEPAPGRLQRRRFRDYQNADFETIADMEDLNERGMNNSLTKMTPGILINF